MHERRNRRSGKKSEALRLLLESVRERSDVSAIAVVDAHGAVVGGAGEANELAILGAVAAPAAAGPLDAAAEWLTRGTDVLARPLEAPFGTLYLAALGSRVSRMSEAARSATRILATV